MVNLIFGMILFNSSKIYTILLQLIMDEKKGNFYNKQNRFNYSTEFDKKSIKSLNLNHSYLELYEKFTFNSQKPYQTRAPFRKQLEQTLQQCSFPNRSIEQELTIQNNFLKQQLKESHTLIENLRLQLHLGNIQLEQISKITKIEAYQYKNAIRDLQDEIAIILDKNNQLEFEIQHFKQIIKNMTEESNKNSIDFNRHHVRTKSLGRKYQKTAEIDKKRVKVGQLQHQQGQIDRQNTTKLNFIDSIERMYTKIMGMDTLSLRELWKWLKNMGQMYSGLRKWKHRTKDILKSSLSAKNQKLIEILVEAVDFIY